MEWTDGVRIESSGTLPAGLAAGTTYYVIPAEDETLKLATSAANALAGIAIAITNAGQSPESVPSSQRRRTKKLSCSRSICRA